MLLRGGAQIGAGAEPPWFPLTLTTGCGIGIVNITVVIVCDVTEMNEAGIQQLRCIISTQP